MNIEQCLEIKELRDNAKTLEEREQYKKLLETAIQDFIDGRPAVKNTYEAVS